MFTRYRLTLLIAALALGAVAALPGRAAQTVWLAGLDLSSVEQGWGTPHRDQSVEGHPLSIGGRKFEHGLGTHSPGVFFVALNGGSTRFRASAGIDDEVGKRGSATFAVIGDGKTLWSSGVLHGGDAARDADVDVSGVKLLLLEVGDAADGYEYDHADWAEARLDVGGTPPVAGKAAAGPDPVVAPPPAPSRPVITSPAVVDADPTTPFLFSITSLGRPPLRFSVHHLPHGLGVDPVTGVMLGHFQKPGTYEVTLRVTNAQGAAERPLRIQAMGGIAHTPPLGWNSYDAYGDDVTEAEVLANARYLKEHLRPYGYQYVVVDYRWYDAGAAAAPNNAGARAGAALTADKYGRLLPAPNRFPSVLQDLSAPPTAPREAGTPVTKVIVTSNQGFKSLADAIHAMGLKFGIHVMRGIPRQAVKTNTPIFGSPFHAADAANTASVCPWCPDMYGVDTTRAAGQAWYDSILDQYSEWGVDLIKVDDMSSPYSAGEIEAVRKAIAHSGRSIVLSLSPGETPLSEANHVQQFANMWRISGDFWDDWHSLNHQFDLIAAWRDRGGPGHWPDADMIPLGHLSLRNRSVGKDRLTGFTRNEQVTLLSLWALAPSPLMLGMNLPDNDAFTEALLRNEEVLAVNQDSLGQQAQRVKRAADGMGTEVWSKQLADGSVAVGLFNRLGAEMAATVNWSDVGAGGRCSVRDLWQRKDLGEMERYATTLPPHGAVLLRVTSSAH